MSIKIKKFKVGRRLGSGVFDKCATPQFLTSQSRKSVRTGRPRKTSDYGFALLDKQRVRFAYGVSEKQFRKYVEMANSMGHGGKKPADLLFQILESRLDNIVYRLGIAPTRRMARQLVSHGHLLVNGVKTTIPSHSPRSGDTVSVREASREKGVFFELEKKMKGYKSPNWLKKDPAKLSAEIAGVPTDPDQFFNFNAVIEFYSR